MIHFTEFCLFLFQPSGFTLLSARGMSWSSLLYSDWGVGGDFVSETWPAWVQTFPVLCPHWQRWVTQVWALFWARNFQGSKCSTKHWGVLSLALPPVQLCPGAALCCWSSTEGLQTSSWSHRWRNCLPRSEASNSNGTEEHLNEIYDRMSVITECWMCFWEKYHTWSIVCISWVL